MLSLKIRQRAGIILASTCAALLVSGCGGGVSPIDTAQEPALQSVQYAAGGTSQPDHASADTFTLKPAKDFNGFNPELWNDRKAWYECDCGRHPQAQQAKIMSWNPV